MIIRTLLTLSLLALLHCTQAQLAIIGLNAETPDELVILAYDNLAVGEVYHITDNEYDETTNSFTTGEGYVTFSTVEPVERGDVFSLKNDGGWTLEGSTKLVFDGTTGGINFSLGNEQAYVYQTMDNTVTGAVTIVHAAVDTWIGEMPSTINPISNHPNAIVIDILDNRRNISYAGSRESGNIGDILNLDNWLLSDDRIESDLTDFALAALPVELVSFEGKKENNRNILQWETATEFNNDKFIIERSRDGIHFEALGDVLGSGTSTFSSSYEYIDNSPINGINYYRLKQVDFDGQYTKSHSVMIENKNTVTIHLYPTIVTHSVQVDLLADEAVATFFNTNGVMVFQQQIANGANLIDLSSIVSGAYYVAIQTPYETVTEKLIKQ